MPPTSVTIPTMFSFTIQDVIDGVKSLATRTVPDGAEAMSTSSLPSNIVIRPFLISSTSDALCLVSSSSAIENTPMNISHT